MLVLEGWSATLRAGSARGRRNVQPQSAPKLKEGGADMGLLSRFSKLALALFVLLTLTAIPGTWFPHQTGSWLSTTPAWAGSPDETLKPKNPASIFVPPSLETSAQARVTSVASPHTQVVTLRTRFAQFVVVWRIYLASVLRF